MNLEILRLVQVRRFLEAVHQGFLRANEPLGLHALRAVPRSAPGRCNVPMTCADNHPFFFWRALVSHVLVYILDVASSQNASDDQDDITFLVGDS